MDQSSCSNYTPSKRFYVLTGLPGIGKTTAIKRICSMITERKATTFGFFTEEIRENGKRIGFDVVTLDNNYRRRRLARDVAYLQPPIPKQKVGKYCVFVKEFEDIALPLFDMEDNKNKQIIVIDEIGKMELFSEQFKTKIADLFNKSTECIVLATIPAKNNHHLIELIRTHKETKLINVTLGNRDEMPDTIVDGIMSSLYC